MARAAQLTIALVAWLLSILTILHLLSVFGDWESDAPYASTNLGHETQVSNDDGNFLLGVGKADITGLVSPSSLLRLC